MKTVVLGGIGSLVCNCADPRDVAAPMSAFGELGVIENAAVAVGVPEAGEGLAAAGVAATGSASSSATPVILWAGPERELTSSGLELAGAERRDLEGRAVIPGFVDSHTHLVFAGDRSAEFEARMGGSAPYDGGGIMSTVRSVRGASEEELVAHTRRLVAEARAQGTTLVEIKSGYGLSLEDELRLLRVASAFTDEVTFLGAHVVPAEWANDRDGYLSLVCGEMLEAVVAEGAAVWADVFCEPRSAAAFDGEETKRVLAAASGAGLALRVHGAQLGEGPGPLLACEFGAASVDHCTFLSDEDLAALAASWEGKTGLPGQGASSGLAGDHRRDAAAYGTVATYLPAVEFCTKQPYPNMRRAVEAGVPVAIATDCNPGTCCSTSMPFAIAVAVREMGLSPAEALWAGTAGSALSLRRNDVGVIRAGARADLAVVDAPSYMHIVYQTGVPLVRALDL